MADEPTVTLTVEDVPLSEARKWANRTSRNGFGLIAAARKAVEEYDEAHRPRYEAVEAGAGWDVSAIDLDALEAVASAATPGPWSCPTRFAVVAPAWNADAKYAYEQVAVTTLKRDAAFVAAANPATVLALIERVRRAEAPS